ncbi:MAG: pantoate--beta-alanine ligase [Planctomycetota bacterium]|nr:pantoate--beta-alanine ligase [Planctomycetota bacterium]MDP6502444.1 pantoate--beta-alanine ligase [Planctomycetota bacterium]
MSARPQLFQGIDDVRACVRACRAAGESVGLVPTMGALHEGHLSLVRASRAATTRTVVTIFVNPTQFGPDEDLDSYPRTLEADLDALAALGVDAVFHPEPAVMYPDGDPFIQITPSVIDQNLCGLARPGHFQGVCTVVAKLFNIIPADKAFFGRKDAQQAAILKRMVKDLDFPIEINICPIVREEDGLAMSSRNKYLESEERAQATALSQALAIGKQAIADGERNSATLKQVMKDSLSKSELVHPEYVSIVDFNTFVDTETIGPSCLAAIAAQVGPARLIDNMLIDGDTGECEM